jgi:hypothetical protein
VNPEATIQDEGAPLSDEKVAHGERGMGTLFLNSGALSDASGFREYL